MRVLVTGAAGFVGHHVAAHLQDLGHEVVAMVRMNQIGDLRRLNDVGFIGEVVWHDLRSPVPAWLKNVDAIIHLAAETHVDRSITDPMSFVMSNVVGTTNLLNWALSHLNGPFVLFSTDEVFGPALQGCRFNEDDAHHPRNPYAATKSACEALARAYASTYGMDLLIPRGMNIFGPRQHPEKFIPKVIGSILRKEKILVHANQQKTKSGSRFYIHVANVADALAFLLQHDVIGAFHIVGEKEIFNDQLVRDIGNILGMSYGYELVDFHSSRPGHDLRYALADNALSGLGWKPVKSYEEGLAETVNWFRENPQWL